MARRAERRSVVRIAVVEGSGRRKKSDAAQRRRTMDDVAAVTVVVCLVSLDSRGRFRVTRRAEEYLGIHSNDSYGHSRWNWEDRCDIDTRGYKRLPLDFLCPTYRAWTTHSDDRHHYDLPRKVSSIESSSIDWIDRIPPITIPKNDAQYPLHSLSIPSTPSPPPTQLPQTIQAP